MNKAERSFMKGRRRRPTHAPPPTAVDPLPAFAADGTDLTVIRWMLALSPEERLRWLQTHLRGVATLRRDRTRA